MKKVLAGLVALMLALAACGDDDGDSSDSGAATNTDTSSDTSTDTGGDSGGDSGGDFSVMAALGEVPAGLEGPIEMGDIVAALEVVGLTRTDSIDGESVLGWIRPITGAPGDDGPSPVFVPIPEELGLSRMQFVDEFHDELGWSVVNVDWFVAAGDPPTRFAVAGGQFDDTALDGLSEVADGVVTAGEGDDYFVDIANRTTARPLGDPLRLARSGDRIAMSKSTPLVETWLRGGDTLADDPDLAAIAGALDDVGVVGAFLHAGEGRSGAVSIGLGWSVDGETPVVTVVHRFGAEASADDVRSEWESALENPALSGLELGDVSVDGETAVVTLRVTDGPPSRVLNMMYDRSLPFGP